MEGSLESSTQNSAFIHKHHLRLQESPKCFVSKTQQPLFLVDAPGYHVSWICYTTVVPLLCTCITPLLACCCNLFVLRLEVKHK